MLSLRIFKPCAVLPALLLFASAFALPLPAAALTYTMEEAVNEALKVNPVLESSAQYLRAAESARLEARAGFGPSLAVPDLYRFTRKSDQSFNKKLAFIIRIFEDNDIEPFGVAEFVCKPVPEYPVACHDRVFH